MFFSIKHIPYFLVLLFIWGFETETLAQTSSTEEIPIENLAQEDLPFSEKLASLKALLQTEESVIKDQVAIVLKEYSQNHSLEVVQLLLGVLREAPDLAKRRASYLLWQLPDSQIQSSLPVLLPSLQSNNILIQRTILQLLKKQKSPREEIAQELLPLLNHKNQDIQTTALQIFMQSYPDKLPLEILMPLFLSEDEEKSKKAWLILQKLPLSQTDLPLLLTLPRLNQEKQKQVVSFFRENKFQEELVEKGEADPKAQKAIIATLKELSIQKNFSLWVLELIPYLKEKAQPLTPEFLYLLGSEERDISQKALEAIQIVGAPSWDILQSALQKQNTNVKLGAIRCIAGIFGRDKQGLALLENVLEKESWIIAQESADAILWLSLEPSPKVLEFLLNKLSSPSEIEKKWAKNKLQSISSRALPLVPKLIEILQQKPSSSHLILEILASTGTKEQEAIVVVAQIMKNSQGSLKKQAFLTMAQLDPSLSKSKEIWKEALLKEQGGFLAIAIKTVEKAGKKAKALIPSLIHNLQSKDHRIRFFALGALAQVDLQAKPITRLIIYHVRDPHPKVRGKALSIMEKNSALVLAALKKSHFSDQEVSQVNITIQAMGEAVIYSESYPWVRSTLKKAPFSASSIIPFLIQQIERQQIERQQIEQLTSPVLEKRVVNILSDMGNEAVIHLQPLRSHRSQAVRQTVKKALSSIEKQK